jgi:hypothetical protein
MRHVDRGVSAGVYREAMAPTHGEIVKQLGDGWSVAWDATVSDAKTRRAMDAAVKESSDALRAVIGSPGASEVDSVAVEPRRARRSASTRS